MAAIAPSRVQWRWTAASRAEVFIKGRQAAFNAGIPVPVLCGFGIPLIVSGGILLRIDRRTHWHRMCFARWRGNLPVCRR
jgi:hypothetical protein